MCVCALSQAVVAAEERAAAVAAALLEEEAQAEAAKEAGTKKKKKKGKKKGGAAVATHTPSPPPPEHGPTSTLEPSNDSDDAQVRLHLSWTSVLILSKVYLALDMCHPHLLHMTTVHRDANDLGFL
jgi:hypothetical protein